MAVVVKIFSGEEGYKALCHDWLTLSRRCATSFLHYPFWYGAELNSYAGKHPSVFFLGVYQLDKLVAVIPLEQVQLEKYGLSINVLELFYSNEMGVCDITAEVSMSAIEKDLQTSLKAIGRLTPFIKCQGVSERSLLYKHQLSLGASHRKRSHDSKYIDFSSGREAFWASYNSKFRRNLKRKISKAAEQGTLSLVSESSVDELSKAFDIFLKVEGSGWKGKDKTSIDTQPDKRKYYQYLLEQYGQEGLCRINLLYLADECIAAQFSILVDNTLHLLKIGYDEQYADISPGYILLEKLVEYGCETQKFNRISFVTGVTWIDRWKPLAEEVNVSYFSGGGLLGRCAVKAMSVLARK